MRMRFAVEALIVVAWAIGGYALARAYGGERAGPRMPVAVALACAAVALLVVAVRHRGTPPVLAAVPVDSAPAAHVAEVDCARARIAVTAPARGALDHVESDEVGAHDLREGEHVGAGDGLVLTGWAVGAGGHAPAAGACAVVDGRVIRQRAQYGAQRDDVATALATPATAPSGYTITFDVGVLRAGAHELRVAVLAPGGRYALLPVARHLVVEPAANPRAPGGR